MLVRFRGGWIAGLGLLSVACAEAAREFTDEVTCSSCRVGLEHVATLGSAGGPGAMSGYPEVARDSRGRYYVTTWRRDLPAVYDSAGHFMQLIGAEGEGPGEFRWAGPIVVAPGDTIYVFDRAIARLSVLDPDYRYVRSVVGVPRAYDAVWLGRGVIAVDYRRGGEPSIRLIGLDGSELARFGEGPAMCDRCGSFLHRLSRDRDGSVLSVKRLFEYEITRWSPTGDMLERWRPRSAWFLPYDSIRPPSPNDPPLAEGHGVWRDEQGLLWVAGVTPADDWRDGFGEESVSQEGVRHTPITDRTKIYDGVIEVIDAATGQAVARHVWPEVASFEVIEPGLIGTVRTDADGWYFVDAYRVTLDEYRN